MFSGPQPRPNKQSAKIHKIPPKFRAIPGGGRACLFETEEIPSHFYDKNQDLFCGWPHFQNKADVFFVEKAGFLFQAGIWSSSPVNSLGPLFGCLFGHPYFCFHCRQFVFCYTKPVKFRHMFNQLGLQPSRSLFGKSRKTLEGVPENGGRNQMG